MTATTLNLAELGAQVAAVRAQLTAPGAPFEVVQVTLPDGQQVPAYRHAFATLPQLLQAGRVHSALEFMVLGEDRWSFARTFDAVDAMASRLQHDLGVQPGTRVAIAMRNRPEWVISFMAIALIGAVPVPLNSFGLANELAANLQDTTPAWLVCDTERWQRVQAQLPALGVQALVVDGAPGEGAMPWAALTAPGHRGWVAPQVQPDDTALILFTSGATSRPKGVASSHRAVCQAVFNMDCISAMAAMLSPDAVAAIMAKKLQPTTLSVVPLFHVSGLHAQMLVSLRHGRRLVFMPRWQPEQALEMIRREQVTQFNGAPSMVQQLLALPQFADPAYSGTLGGLGFGGSGLHPRLIDDVLTQFAGRMSGVGFGMTETNGVCAGSSGRVFEANPASSGVLAPIIEVRIADSTGEALPAGEAGEVWMRGVTLLQSYWQQPEATAQAMSQGWFRSGDIGVLDAHGFLTIVDRIKDVINRSGEKIAAAEVEACLLQHPAVEEAAVFAMPHLVTAEQVTAVAVIRPGHTLTSEALRAFVAERLAAYKVPEQLWVRSDALPRNPAGKMLKSAVRQQFESQAQTA